MYRVVVLGASDTAAHVRPLLDGSDTWRLRWVCRTDDLPGVVESEPPDLIVAVPPSGLLGRWLDALEAHRPGTAPVMALVTVDPPPADVARLPDVADFEVAPWRLAAVRLRIGRLLARGRTRVVRETCGQLTVRLGLDELVGEDGSFAAVRARLPLVAGSDVTVLISGETGTGKEVVARAIHYLSPRAGGPFLPVNCGAIPTELFENELFGHSRGAFTDARRSAAGVIAEAEGGTLFLDEVDAVPLLAQTKLLQFLQHQTYRPLGTSALRRADIRIIAASNADLEAAVAKGTFRQDLYYRLNIIPISLPPLRERPRDIPVLARHFLQRHGGRTPGRTRPLAPGFLELLQAHPWPGNVRELENVIQQVLALAPPGPLGPETLPRRFHQREPVPAPRSFREAKARAVAAFERDYVGHLLAAHRGNITQAAREARKDRRAFGRLVQKYGVDRPASGEVRRSG